MISGAHIRAALERKIPYLLVLGPNELAKGLVVLRDLDAAEQFELPMDALVAELQRRING